MLCAEDEQSRTCWMTAFRLLKVNPSLLCVVIVVKITGCNFIQKKICLTSQRNLMMSA